MTDACKDCLFAENVEDEDYMACQARQMLVMPFDKVCDYFEAKGCVCEECTMPMDLNGVNEYIADMQDKYTNTTYKLPECTCNACRAVDECCNANSHPDEIDEALEELLDDLKSSYLGILETAAALNEGGKTQHVLSEILAMESTIALIKRYLLELEE